MIRLRCERCGYTFERWEADGPLCARCEREVQGEQEAQEAAAAMRQAGVRPML